MSSPRVAVFSFADIDNYGDILFSWVVRSELRKRRPDVITDFYAPTDCWIEGEYYHGYTRDRIDGQYDALILAGGEVVHFFDQRTWEPIYQRRELSVLSERASDVVWDWASCRAKLKAWLSVGVRPFEDEHNPAKVESVLHNLDFISTRGILSKKILEGGAWSAYEPRIQVTPDLGWLFPRLAEEVDIDETEFKSRLVKDGDYAVFQFHNITKAEAGEIARVLKRFKMETGINVVLLPVIHLWNDREPMQWIVEASGGDLLMPSGKQGPFEIANIVMGAELVLSSSLHVAITALAAGIPAGIFNKWPGTKFQDLMGLQMRSQHFIRNIDHIPYAIEALLKERAQPQRLITYSKFMTSTLDEVFDGIVVKL